jgi:hypothetical protein
MKNTHTKHFLWGFLLIFLALVSCDPIEEEQMLQDKTEKLLKIQKMIEERGFEFELIDSKTKEGIKVKNLSELNDLLKVMSGETKDQKSISKILTRNGLKEIPNLIFTSLEVLRVENKDLSSNNRIECIQNWRNVYGKIGVASVFGPSTIITWIDFGFTVGTGSGLIENWNSTLEGFTVFHSLGKNDFRNNGYASPSNGNVYSGIYYFNIRVKIFFEGIGEVWTYQSQKVQILVDGCSGQVTYNWIVE